MTAMLVNPSHRISTISGDFLRQDGTTPLTADWSVGSFNIKDLLDPVDPQDAATKAYVDSVAAPVYTAGNGIVLTGFSFAADYGVGLSSTIQPDDSAGNGVSNKLSRADHKHAIVAAAPASVNALANAEGVSTSFARADHAHRLELNVFSAGSAIGSRPRLNFIGATVADNPGSDRVDVTFAGGSPYLAGTGLTLTVDTFSVNYGTTAGTSLEGTNDALYVKLAGAQTITGVKTVNANLQISTSRKIIGVAELTLEAQGAGNRVDVAAGGAVRFRVADTGAVDVGITATPSPSAGLRLGNNLDFGSVTASLSAYVRAYRFNASDAHEFASMTYDAYYYGNTAYFDYATLGVFSKAGVEKARINEGLSIGTSTDPGAGKVLASSALGVGTVAPVASAALDLVSTTKGALLPRLTTTQRNAVASPALSLLIFNTTAARFEFWDGAAWQPLVGGGGTYYAGTGLTLSGGDTFNVTYGTAVNTALEGSADAGLVHKAGAETVTGVKTFDANLAMATARKILGDAELTLEAQGAANRVSVRANGATRFRVSETGAVDIGLSAVTPSPTAGLWVANNFEIGSTTFSLSAYVRSYRFNASDAHEFASLVYDAYYFGNTAFVDYATLAVFQKSGVEKARINEGLSIGTSTDPGAGKVLASSALGVGTVAPVASAALDLVSTTKGALVPRMTTVQRDAIGTPALSLLIFNTTTARYEYWDGAAWVPLAPAASGGTVPVYYVGAAGIGPVGVNPQFATPAAAYAQMVTDGLSISNPKTMMVAPGTYTWNNTLLKQGLTVMGYAGRAEETIITTVTGLAMDGSDTTLACLWQDLTIDNQSVTNTRGLTIATANAISNAQLRRVKFTGNATAGDCLRISGTGTVAATLEQCTLVPTQATYVGLSVGAAKVFARDCVLGSASTTKNRDVVTVENAGVLVIEGGYSYGKQTVNGASSTIEHSMGHQQTVNGVAFVNAANVGVFLRKPGCRYTVETASPTYGFDSTTGGGIMLFGPAILDGLTDGHRTNLGAIAYQGYGVSDDEVVQIVTGAVTLNRQTTLAIILPLTVTPFTVTLASVTSETTGRKVTVVHAGPSNKQTITISPFASQRIAGSLSAIPIKADCSYVFRSFDFGGVQDNLIVGGFGFAASVASPTTYAPLLHGLKVTTPADVSEAVIGGGAWIADDHYGTVVKLRVTGASTDGTNAVQVRLYRLVAGVWTVVTNLNGANNFLSITNANGVHVTSDNIASQLVDGDVLQLRVTPTNAATQAVMYRGTLAVTP